MTAVFKERDKMEKIFKEALEAVKSGKDVILASVIAASGSTPRGEGAKMLVYPDGSTKGTIGGGNVEHICTLKAVEALKHKKSFTESYSLNAGDTADIGMICGGNVEVCFKYFSEQDIEMLEYINGISENAENVWLLTRVSETSVEMGVYSEKDGVKYIAVSDEKAKEWLKNKHSFKDGICTVFAEPLFKKGRVYIFGAGHVSRELAPLLTHLGFKVSVYEERDSLINTFPKGMEIIKGEFKNIDKYINITEDDYAVVMTSGHVADYDILEQITPKDISYTGVIGSRTKIAATREKLLSAGIEEEKIDRIHTPIGLDIKAETPAEIAVSIAAELILHRAETK
mgnify:FL=1